MLPSQVKTRLKTFFQCQNVTVPQITVCQPQFLGVLGTPPASSDSVSNQIHHYQKNKQNVSRTDEKTKE
jgi:hypothetical protein